MHFIVGPTNSSSLGLPRIALAQYSYPGIPGRNIAPFPNRSFFFPERGSELCHTKRACVNYNKARWRGVHQ